MPLSSAVWDALLLYHLSSAWVNAGTRLCLLASVWLLSEEEVLLQCERKEVKGHFAQLRHSFDPSALGHEKSEGWLGSTDSGRYGAGPSCALKH